MIHWYNYWAKRGKPGHRWDKEEFYEKLAQEQLFHLNGGHSLLDFGCGSGDVLLYYTSFFSQIVGVDFSENMLNNAKKRLSDHKIRHVELIHADDKTVWGQLENKFDRIITSGVIQYFDFEQIGCFLKNSGDYLNAGGKIVFFDIIDPWIYLLFEAGLIGRERSGILKALKTFIISNAEKLINKSKGLPACDMGYSYNPNRIIEGARKLGYRSEYVCSMHYEYRYHLIFTHE